MINKQDNTFADNPNVANGNEMLRCWKLHLGRRRIVLSASKKFDIHRQEVECSSCKVRNLLRTTSGYICCKLYLTPGIAIDLG